MTDHTISPSTADISTLWNRALQQYVADSNNDLVVNASRSMDLDSITSMISSNERAFVKWRKKDGNLSKLFHVLKATASPVTAIINFIGTAASSVRIVTYFSISAGLNKCIYV